MWIWSCYELHNESQKFSQLLLSSCPYHEHIIKWIYLNQTYRPTVDGLFHWTRKKKRVWGFQAQIRRYWIFLFSFFYYFLNVGSDSFSIKQLCHLVLSFSSFLFNFRKRPYKICWWDCRDLVKITKILPRYCDSAKIPPRLIRSLAKIYIFSARSWWPCWEYQVLAR